MSFEFGHRQSSVGAPVHTFNLTTLRTRAQSKLCKPVTGEAGVSKFGGKA